MALEAAAATSSSSTGAPHSIPLDAPLCGCPSRAATDDARAKDGDRSPPMPTPPGSGCCGSEAGAAAAAAAAAASAARCRLRMSSLLVIFQAASMEKSEGVAGLGGSGATSSAFSSSSSSSSSPAGALLA